MKAASPSLEPDDELDEFPATDEASPLTLIPSETGERLDKWLAAQMPDRSRSEIRRWIDAGLVELRGKPLKASHRVAAGDEISLVARVVEVAYVAELFRGRQGRGQYRDAHPIYTRG